MAVWKLIINAGFLLCVLPSFYVTATEQPLRITGFSSAVTALGSSQPLWVTANRGGVYNDGDSVQFRNGVLVDWQRTWTTGFSMLLAIQPSVVLSENAQPLIERAELTVGLPYVRLSAGIIPQTRGYIPDQATSSGSMSISGNARPLPIISVYSDGFVPLPGVQGDVLETSYGISHGRFNDERHIAGALLHEKWLYARLYQPSAFSFHFGLVHHAMWGGNTSGTGALPATWDNYWRVFFARQGGDDANPSDQLNSAGNSLGVLDFGLTLWFSRAVLDLYHHRFYEDRSGLEFKNALDGLWGISVAASHEGWWPRVLTLEIVDTFHQSGKYHDLGEFGRRDIILGGRDSYYHHGTYRSGWTHYSRIIGTPFVLTSGEGADTRISSNRFLAGHLGLRGTIPTSNIDYRLLVSLVTHGASYASVSIIGENEPLQRNKHFYGELVTHNPLGIDSSSLTLGIGYDIRNVGGETGIGGIIQFTKQLY